MKKINMHEELFDSRIGANRPIIIDIEKAEQAARDRLSRAETLDDKISALQEISVIYAYDERHEEALDLVEKYIDCEKDLAFKIELVLVQGKLSEQIGDYDRAIKYYQKALGYGLQEDVDYYFIYNNLGYCNNFKEDFKKAEKCCLKAIRIDRKRYNAWKNLGVSMECRGRYRESAKYFMLAANLSKGETRSMMHLHRLLKRRPELRQEMPSLVAELKNGHSGII